LVKFNGRIQLWGRKQHFKENEMKKTYKTVEEMTPHKRGELVTGWVDMNEVIRFAIRGGGKHIGVFHIMHNKAKGEVRVFFAGNCEGQDTTYKVLADE
jgi:hypothetical protein